MKIKKSGQRAYTFLELMLTVSILSIGIVGIYKVLLSSLNYQTQLSSRLFAMNLLENQIAVLENQYATSNEFLAGEHGKIIEATLDRRTVPFEFSLMPAATESSLTGLAAVAIDLSWPSDGKTISLKRHLYLVNLNVEPSANSLR